MNLSQRQIEILQRAAASPHGKLEFWEAMGVPLEWETGSKVEQQAWADPDLKDLIARGLLRVHSATIREPPVWWTITEPGRAAIAGPQQPSL